MSHFFFWLCHYLTLRKKRNLNFSCYITHHAFIYHTLCCCSSKTATTPGSRVSLGTLRPLINFTAGGKALGWEIPFPWHTRCCDLVGEARGFSWRSRENWSKVRGHRQAEQLRELPVPACFHGSPTEPGSKVTQLSRSLWEQRCLVPPLWA